MSKPECCYVAVESEAVQTLKTAPNMAATDVLGHLGAARCKKTPEWTIYPDPGSDPYRYYTSCDDHVVQFLSETGRSSVLPLRAGEPADDRETAEG